jgi:hypothetical protein
MICSSVNLLRFISGPFPVDRIPAARGGGTKGHLTVAGPSKSERPSFRSSEHKREHDEVQAAAVRGEPRYADRAHRFRNRTAFDNSHVPQLRADVDAELTVPQYLAKSNVMTALGWLVNQTNDDSALGTLINATNADWWASEINVNWSTPIHRDRSELIQALIAKAINGLTLSAAEEASIRLEQLRAQMQPGAPSAALNPTESTLIGRLSEDVEASIFSVSSVTRGAVIESGGEPFLQMQVEELGTIRNLGLREYYSR